VSSEMLCFLLIFSASRDSTRSLGWIAVNLVV
jgi:hypothetical protein